MSWCRQRRLWKQTLRCQRCQSSRAEHEWMQPPIAPLPSCFFFLLSVLMCSPISLSFCTMEYHCGAEILSLTSAGLHNENKWAGSKYAGCLPLYTSQPIGFHQKLRWIVSPKAHDNASQCFIYLKWNSKAVSKDLTCTFSPILNISFKCFYSCGWYFFKVIKMVMIQYVKRKCICSAVYNYTNKHLTCNNM